ncbi:MAG: RyR domain-containing protein [Bacteroidales bacterium]|nr:RyR domain-containing protein [Bacteroidales bacterium]
MKREIQKWSEVIFSPDDQFIQDISSNWIKYKKVFIDHVAEALYEDMRKERDLFISPFTLNKEFRKLNEEEKSPWYEYASEIPVKLRSLNLFIRQYKDFCMTCLITDKDVEKLARGDHDCYSRKLTSDNWKYGTTLNPVRKTDPSLVSYQELSERRKRFYLELNYLLPVQLKKIGYEIIRPEEIAEINENMVRKLARAIHSRYLHELRKQQTGTGKDSHLSGFHYPGNVKDQEFSNFEDLPEEIKYSNIDNAYHIPTKLLSIGYKIRPAGKGFKSVALHLNEEEIETMARVEHIRWSWDKRLNGWRFGNIKDTLDKTHPGLKTYEELPESEKEKDRELVRLIPGLLQDINYEACPVNPGRIKKLSYAIKPQSGINKILDETRQLNDQIRKRVQMVPALEEMIRIRNKKIEEAIKEVEGSYNYAQHIQETFLPDDLYVRECFPDSFVLFKPKDLVSGDFYFFSKQDNIIIFAAADCTGHGIPGALLSTIGYGILDQAVNEIQLTDPSLALHHLYSKIHRFLRRDTEITGMPDDMDIILCSLDIRTNILTYSGVKNPLYHITKNELVEYRANNSLDSCIENSDCMFTSDMIQLKTGDSIYLCSDGYTDQFGGKSHKKYQSSRFKDFLQSIQEYSMPEQSDKLYEEIEKWREENNEDQTDDVLVIGIRI